MIQLYLRVSSAAPKPAAKRSALLRGPNVKEPRSVAVPTIQLNRRIELSRRMYIWVFGCLWVVCLRVCGVMCLFICVSVGVSKFVYVYLGACL